jgi:hypothetical protein
MTQVEGSLAPATDDPEVSAQSFVERNQKEALAHLQALTAEAEKLRARLAKLESGIKRWQTLVNALRSAQGVTAADDPAAPEPIAGAPVGSKSDKRVKWASSTAAPAAEPEPAQPAGAAEPASAPVPPAASPPSAAPAARQPAATAPAPQPR